MPGIKCLNSVKQRDQHLVVFFVINAND